MGHVRELPSNTRLDVCNPGEVGREINIDLTRPTASADLAAGIYPGPFTVTLTGTDPVSGGTSSGVRWMEYSFDGVNWTRVEGSTTAVPLTHSVNLSFRAIDWAGNVGDTVTRNYRVNLPPVAVNDTATTPEDTTLTVDVLGNDSDPDGDALTVTLVAGTGPTHGTIALNANGSFTYTPATNYHGPDGFNYTVNDGHGGSATASVSITVTSVNDPPVAVDDVASTDEDVPATISAAFLVGNDSDPDLDALTLTAVQNVSGGTAAFAAGVVTFTPDPNFHGIASFTYTVGDGNGGFDTGAVTVTVRPVNDPPLAAADTATTNEDVPVTIPALANDSDVDGDTLSVTSFTQPAPAAGVVTLNADGTFTFSPILNFNGAASFAYTVSDGNGGVSTANVTVTVIPVNDPPVAVNDTASTTEDTPVTLTAAILLQNDTDPDGDTLTLTAVQNGPSGTVTLSGSQVIFTPAPNFSGSATFTYTVNDGNGGTAAATVTVTVAAVNDPPVATNDVAAVISGQTATVNVLGNDTDPDGEVPHVTSVGTSPNALIVLNADGTISVTPNPDFVGSLTFPYTIADGSGQTSTATVTVNVSPQQSTARLLDGIRR